MVAANYDDAAPPAAASRGGGVVLALSSLGDPWGVQLTSQVRQDALCTGLSTLVLTDPRWYEHLLGAEADAALLTAIDLEQDGPRRVRSLSDRTRSGLVAFSAQMEPEDFDVVSSTPISAIGRAYARLRARHDRVQLLAPDLGRRVGGTLAHPRTRAFLEAAREHGDPGEQRVHIVPEGSHETYLAGLEWLRGPDLPEAVICFTGYQAVALQLAAERAGVRVPEELEIVSIGDVPAKSEFFGPISYYGVDDVFVRLARIIVDRAVDREDRPGSLHTFDWEFFPGTTTRDTDGAS